jgi:alkylation response protein AidB-like acyl-CoA dehydrogenase
VASARTQRRQRSPDSTTSWVTAAAVNCALNFGEGALHAGTDAHGAIGYLLGEPGDGLPIMFQMMNEARIGVGVGAAALGYAGYVEALALCEGPRRRAAVRTGEGSRRCRMRADHRPR